MTDAPRTSSKMIVTPDMVEIDDNHVRLNADIARQTLLGFNQAATGSDLAETIESNIRMATDYKAPILATPVQGHDGRPILMTYNQQRMPYPAYRDTWVTQGVEDFMRWHGIKESLVRSGVSVITHLFNFESGGDFFPRSMYFKIGQTALFQDPTIITTWPDNLPSPPHQAAHDVVAQIVTAHGSKAIVLKDMMFNGRDLILDPIESRLYIGQNGGFHYDEDREEIERLLKTEANWPIKTVTVTCDASESSHHYLSQGLSPMLPDRRFLVSQTLGKGGDFRYDGYDTLNEYLGKPKHAYSPTRELMEDRLYPVQGDAATKELVTNLLVVGNTVFMSSCPPKLRLTLENGGVQVNAPGWNTHFFSYDRIIGRSSVHNLTNEL